MAASLEVTVTQIQRLADGPLRELIARLCRAELSDAQLPLSAVRAGGHQDAADGGIDVHVDLGCDVTGLDFLPRDRVGLQAKTTALTAAAVAAEMQVRGGLKPAIRELLMRGGAYVLASSKVSCSPTMLDRRRAAMRMVAAEAGLPPDVALDFMGADRLADWTNRHRGVALWLHEQLDGPCHGWRGHGAWAAGAADVGFLADDCARAQGPCGRQLSLGVQEQIVDVSEGSLRIAGAFASAVERGGDLRGLPSANLYQRLFWQRGAYDPELEHVARVLRPPNEARVESCASDVGAPVCGLPGHARRGMARDAA